MPPSGDAARQQALKDALNPDKNKSLGRVPIWIAGGSFASGGSTFDYGDIVPSGIAGQNPGAVVEAEIPDEVFDRLSSQARENYLNRRQNQSKVTARVIPIGEQHG